MTLRNFAALALLAVTSLLASSGARAAADYENCTGFITTLPATINSSGTWCFNQNLSTAITSGQAILVDAENVVIDCNDFKLDGLAAGASTQAKGIVLQNHGHDTVRHCNIRGFYFGVYFNSNLGGGHLVEDNRFDGNTYCALQVDGSGSVVRRNRIFDTGGGTATSNYSAFALSIHDDVDVLDNTIAGVVVAGGHVGSAWGMYVGTPKGETIRGNHISGLVPGVVGPSSGSAIGIYGNDAGPMTLRNNDLVGDGSSFGDGLHCADSQGLAKDNLIKGFVNGLNGCSNNGGNVVKP